MKTPKLIELQRKRVGLVDEARNVLAELKHCTNDKRADELGRKNDNLMRDIDLVDLDIDEERAALEDEAARARHRPDNGGTVAYGADLPGGPAFAYAWEGSNRSGWTDAKGNPIAVLERNEPMATRNDLGVGFGDYVRALVNGPRNDTEKRALSEGTASEGGYTVPAPVSAEFIDKLRANTAAIRAGARTVPMTSATLSMARLDTDPTVSWRLENALIDASDPVFSQLLLEAKACAGIVKVSRELLSDSVNINEILTNAFVQVMARELDRVALWNDGTDDGPVGVAATSGINEVSMATNGSAIYWDKVMDAYYELQLDNVADPTAMIAHPRTTNAIGKLKDGNGNWIAPPPQLSGVPLLSTTAAPIDETQGSASNASSLLIGNFRELFIGLRDQVSITILKERYADYGQVGFLVWMRADVQLAHKASFCALRGIVP